MNGEDCGNECNRRGKDNEDISAEGVDNSREREEGRKVDCNCCGESCDCTKSTHDKQGGTGINDDGPKNTDGDEIAGERLKVIAEELHSIADHIELGLVTVKMARGGKMMTRGKGKKKPEWTGMYGIEIVYMAKE